MLGFALLCVAGKLFLLAAVMLIEGLTVAQSGSVKQVLMVTGSLVLAHVASWCVREVLQSWREPA